MGSIDLREKAIGLANEAVAADNSQQYELALSKYVQAIETFQVAVGARSATHGATLRCVHEMKLIF